MLRRISELAVCYDQVNVGEYAHLEMTARRLYLSEETALEQAFKPDGDAEGNEARPLDDRAESKLLSGAQESRGNARACPLLSQRASFELKA